ncbi:hypothetical protein NV379_02130 [Paenibacillus sp. N1-5-1-14]|uniref:hypothetical protein n=1 Tax=Paenibacillus radicibacter TaxID=2972488 RepID=UPI002158C4D9|nr:hypothetical protein [Paenibacillus radicibacter]MCR8641444.1 hypothetical protein [Paenibacillus radicibacter]
MRILTIHRMPTSTELRSINFTWLESDISRNGGLIFWAKQLNLPSKKPIFKIKDDEIIIHIREIMSALKINRMPSSSEVLQTFHEGEALHKRICDLGYRFWAEKLNLEIKQSETQLGQDYELVAIKMLEEKGYKVERMTTKHPFDLLVNDSIRIDVKSASAYDLKGSRCHTFGINKRYGSCDLYILLALNEESDVIERTFVIPCNKLRVVSMSIGRESKYNKYINKWDYLDTYNAFYKKII